MRIMKADNRAPGGPGLGVDPDPAVIERYRVA